MRRWLETQLEQWPVWGLLVFLALDLVAIAACIRILVETFT